MACIALLTTQMAMATTQFERVIDYEGSAPWLESNTERQPLRMNWVVVTDKNGCSSLRMRWVADEKA
jgi:hypothetical protein